MNAVKNCLAVLAAAVVLASCSADPTSSLAGKAILTATPGTVAIRVGESQQVVASAIDALGGPTDGNFTITNPTPANFTAVVDTSYTTVYAGARPATRTRIVVTALKESDGSFTISGTGGSLVIPVRIAPDTGATAVTFTSASPGIGQSDTAIAPAGLRFTSGTTLSFNGSNGLFTPVVVGFNANFTQVYFIPAPTAHGTLHIEGMANVSTPTNTFGASTIDSVTVPPITSFPATFQHTGTVASNSVDTIIAGTNWKFTPTSVASSNGWDAIPIGISADSGQLYVKPVPGTNGPVTVSGLVFSAYPSSITFTLPSTSSEVVGATTDLGGDDPAGTVPSASLPSHGTYGFWDLGSFQVEDQSPDAGGPGINSQVYRLTLGDSGSLTSDVKWDIGRDVDVMLLADGTTTGGAAFGGFSGATGTAYHEIQKSGAIPAGVYLLDLIDWSPAYPDTPAVGATIRIAIDFK